jgi:hypothetical protein
VTQPQPSDMITISLAIENRYDDGTMIPTEVVDAIIPGPPPEDDPAAFDAWLYEHVHAFTGTGRPHGDAWYDVTVTACTDPNLVGAVFEFGY